MSSQNMVSASISPDTLSDIMTKLDEIRATLGFLVSISPQDVKSIFKAGNAYAPFLDKAYSTAEAYPQIMPAVFDIEEFKRDYQLSSDIAAVAEKVRALSESLDRTLMAVNSDTMSAALEVYSAAKMNREKIPGLNVAIEEMGVFFKRSRKKSSSAE